MIANFFWRKKCEFVSYFSKMCVSTDEYHSMLGKNLISQLEITEKSPATTPPPTDPRRLLEMTEKLCYYPPPPAESRRLLEITEKFCYYPPPLNRVGFWRSRKRLKKSNNLNLAALIYIPTHQQPVGVGLHYQLYLSGWTLHVY